MSMKDPLTPAGIEPATFRFVTQFVDSFNCIIEVVYSSHIFISSF